MKTKQFTVKVVNTVLDETDGRAYFTYSVRNLVTGEEDILKDQLRKSKRDVIKTSRFCDLLEDW